MCPYACVRTRPCRRAARTAQVDEASVGIERPRLSGRRFDRSRWGVMAPGEATTLRDCPPGRRRELLGGITAYLGCVRRERRRSWLDLAQPTGRQCRIVWVHGGVIRLAVVARPRAVHTWARD